MVRHEVSQTRVHKQTERQPFGWYLGTSHRETRSIQRWERECWDAHLPEFCGVLSTKQRNLAVDGTGFGVDLGEQIVDVPHRTEIKRSAGEFQAGLEILRGGDWADLGGELR
jgi:hypothetical protein